MLTWRADDAVAAEEAASSAENMCIEPPLPFEAPAARPVSSAITAFGSMPAASMWPWSR